MSNYYTCLKNNNSGTPILLGKGAFGKVYKVYQNGSGKIFAAKVQSVNKQAITEGVTTAMMSEISFLKSIPPHPNIIHLRDVYVYDDNCLVTIVDIMQKSLHDYLAERPQTSYPTREKWMTQLMSGLCHLHLLNVMHRDIKPANILIDFQKNIKISDFGSARNTINQTRPSFCMTTLHYRAPEIILHDVEYTAQVDMWSAGVICLELLTNRMPFISFSFGKGGDNPMDRNVCKEILQTLVKYFGKQKLLLSTLERMEFATIYHEITPENTTGVSEKIIEKLLYSYLHKEIPYMAYRLVKNLLVFEPTTRWTARRAYDWLSLRN